MSKCRYDLSVDCNSNDCVSCVLDKMRAEIKELSITEHIGTHKIYVDVYNFKENVLEIIDKYQGGEGKCQN